MGLESALEPFSRPALNITVDNHLLENLFLRVNIVDRLLTINPKYVLIFGKAGNFFFFWGGGEAGGEVGLEGILHFENAIPISWRSYFRMCLYLKSLLWGWRSIILVSETIQTIIVQNCICHIVYVN